MAKKNINRSRKPTQEETDCLLCEERKRRCICVRPVNEKTFDPAHGSLEGYFKFRLAETVKFLRGNHTINPFKYDGAEAEADRLEAKMWSI